jgi:CRP-like cAMP-binding protein
MASAALPVGDACSEAKLLGRRSLARVPMDLTVRLHLASSPGPLPARARDLGVGGVCVATPAPFALPDLRRVSLLHANERIEVKAEGRWQVEVPGRDGHLSGIRFHDVDARTLERLWDAVHTQTKQLSRWLSQHSELKALPLPDLIQLLQAMRLRELASGEVVYQQGVRQPGDDSILVVRRGRVALETRSPRAQRVALGHATAGQVLGGSAVLCGAPPLESAVVCEAASLLEISRASLGFVQAACPALAADLAAIVTRSYVLRQHAALCRALDGR